MRVERTDDGVVALAGDGTDLATVAAEGLTEPHPNPLRRPVDGDPLTSLVDAAMQAIEYHSELAYTPVSPDLLRFWCVVPPAERGETLLCDGVALARCRQPAPVRSAARAARAHGQVARYSPAVK